MEILASVHFVYNWHPNKNFWNIHELKTLIMDNSNPNILGHLNISDDRSITIQDSLLVNHPLQGVVGCRGWSRMKRGDEQTFGMTKKIEDIVSDKEHAFYYVTNDRNVYSEGIFSPK
jgi:hypothetical protein